MPMRGTDATLPANKEAPMKKLVMTLTVLAFLSGSAMAAAPAAEKDTKAAKDTKDKPAKEEKSAPAPKDDKAAGADKAKK